MDKIYGLNMILINEESKYLVKMRMIAYKIDLIILK
jgi:hypothetical protein